MSNLGVAIVTNGRNPPLLSFLLRRWIELGVTTSLRHCRSPETFGDSMQEAMAELDTEFVLIGADDVLPLAGAADWDDVGSYEGIEAVRMIQVTGARWFDWARQLEDGQCVLQPYEEPADPTTYITGNAQVWGPEARRVLSWSGAWGSGDDIAVCRRARAAGLKLSSPWSARSPGGEPSHGPALVHLDQRVP